MLSGFGNITTAVEAVRLGAINFLPKPVANPPGLPAPRAGGPLAGPRETVPFDVLGPPAADNGRLEVGFTWDRPTADWDLYVVNDADEVVAVSAAGATTGGIPSAPAGPGSRSSARGRGGPGARA